MGRLQGNSTLSAPQPSSFLADWPGNAMHMLSGHHAAHSDRCTALKHTPAETALIRSGTMMPEHYHGKQGFRGQQKMVKLVQSGALSLDQCTARLAVAALTKLWRHNAGMPPQAAAHNLHLNLAIGKGLCNPLLIYPFLQATLLPMGALL